MPIQHRSLQFCSSLVQCSDVVRNIEVLFDSELTWPAMSWKSKVCWYHLRRSRCDGSTAAITGHHSHWLLQRRTRQRTSVRVENLAARLVLGLDRRAHISTALKRLHWLSVKYRVLLNLVTLMHRYLHRGCPAYPMDIITSQYVVFGRRQHESLSWSTWCLLNTVNQAFIRTVM